MLILYTGLHEVAKQGLDIVKKHHEAAEEHLGIAKARLSKEE